MKLDPHNYLFCPICQQGHVHLTGTAIVLPTENALEYNLIYSNLNEGLAGNLVFDTNREALDLDMRSGTILYFRCKSCDFQWKRYIVNHEEDVIIVEENGDDPFAVQEDFEDFEGLDDEDEGEEWKRGKE
jgi:hypothetical protein